jgi:arylsulfatase A-like enzyme
VELLSVPRAPDVEYVFDWEFARPPADPATPLVSLLLPLPVLAIVLAALETVLARAAMPWRAGEVRLFFEAYFLWVGLGLLALLPARPTLRFLDARSRPWPARGTDARPWIVLLGWMVLPVAGAATLGEHTTLVGFAGLASVRPWLELGGALGGIVLALALLGRWLGSVPGARTASAGVVLSLGVALWIPSRPEPAASAPAPARPNLLLLVWDTCRSDRLEAYGYARPTTPHLAELAKESIVFEDSLSASTFTFTSHLSLLTGAYPATHGARLLDMRFDPARAGSIAEELTAAGYRTGGFVGTDVLSGRTGIRRGFEVYDDEVDPPLCDTFAWGFVHDVQTLLSGAIPALRFNGQPHWIQDFQRPASEVLERALAWIHRDDPRPWFCFVNLYDAHWPYLPEGEGRSSFVRPYDGPVDGYLFRSDRWRGGYRMTSADESHVGDLYDGELLDLDAEVDRFVRALELERGGTAVLLTADHGEGLGEGDSPVGGLWNHDDVREPQVRVPLVLRLPERSPEGRRVRAPVSGVDVAPTLLALAGLEPGPNVEGRNLLAGEPASGRERWVDDRDHFSPDEFRWAFYRGSFKLVRTGAGSAASYELFDLAADPAATTDVQREHPEVLAEMVARLEARTPSGAATPSGPGWSEGDALQALGYAGN